MSGIGMAFAGLNIAGKLTGAKAALAKVPTWLWYAIAAAAVLIGGYLYHGHRVHVHDKAIIAAEDARISKQALALKAKADALTAKISADERNRNDEQNRLIAADAGALRLSGPGKAVCPGRIGIAAASGGHVAPGGSGNAAVDPVPDPTGLELIGVPFNDAVNFGADHDVDRAEVISWREWYRKLAAAWPKEAATTR